MGHTRTVLVAIGAAAGAASAGTIGPDIVVSAIHNTARWGEFAGIGAYSIGTVSCNLGDTNADWYAGTSAHPVIAQNLYRLSDGRFVQIGMSWVKHGFFAVNQSACAPCATPPGSVLGVGCSDPYDASLNGDQYRLGPRSDINAWTGEFPVPSTFGWQQIGPIVYKRALVPGTEMDPLQHPGARYFAEGQYVARDDALAGNQMNNVSYREFLPERPSSGSFDLILTGPTFLEQPAIFAWRDIDPLVEITTVDVPDDGRMHVAVRVYDLGSGLWRYEYALHNMNSHRSAASFRVPIAAGTIVSQTGFRDVEYHSGEPISSQDWTLTVDPGEVRWETQGFVADPNANAVRWGTVYNFWFTADRPPAPTDAAIGLFRPGTPDQVSVGLLAPAVPPPQCTADANNDGQTNGADLSVLLTMFGGVADPPGSGADFNGDGDVNGADLSILLSEFGCGT